MRSRSTELRRPRLWPTTSLLTLLALTACGGDDLLLPSSGQPVRIEVVSGNGQTGTVGQPLGNPLVVLVTDPANRPVAEVEVVFIAPAGAELTPSDTVLTGPDGRATVSYTLDTLSGEQTIEARAKPIVASASLTTTFTQTAEPEVATELVMMDGDGQTAEVQTALEDSLAVKARDRFGNGVAGIEVTWQAADGAVSPTSVVTGADGRAATQRTLGQRTGVYRATATADLQGSPVSFEATAIAPPSPQLVLVTQPASGASAGIAFERQPVLQLQDAVGAPLLRADVTVTVQIATGGGSLGGNTTATSNAEGRVSFEDLSIRGRPGKRTLLFAAIDFTPATSDEIDVSPGPPAPSRSSAQVANGIAGATTPISVNLKDEFDTGVEGAAGSIAILIDGVNPVAQLVVTDEGDGAYSASYVPVHIGTDQVNVLVGGTPLGGSPFGSQVEPGPAAASTTTAEVTKSGVVFYQVSILVTTRDAQGNLRGRGGEQVQIQVNGGDALRNAQDHGDGTYSDSFITIVFNPTIVILLNGVPIAGNPYTP